MDQAPYEEEQRNSFEQNQEVEPVEELKEEEPQAEVQNDEAPASSNILASFMN